MHIFDCFDLITDHALDLYHASPTRLHVTASKYVQDYRISRHVASFSVRAEFGGYWLACQIVGGGTTGRIPFLPRILFRYLLSVSSVHPVNDRCQYCSDSIPGLADTLFAAVDYHISIDDYLLRNCSNISAETAHSHHSLSSSSESLNISLSVANISEPSSPIIISSGIGSSHGSLCG